MEDRAKEWLQARGLVEADVRAGTEGRVHAWELAAREMAEGWDLDEHGYAADLRDRHLLHEMQMAGLLDDHHLKRVQLADHQFKGSTTESEQVQSDLPGLDQQTHWWFWRRPI